MEVNFSNDSAASMTPWGSIDVQLKAKEAWWRGRSSQELLGNMSFLSHNFTLKLLTFAPHIKHCARSGTEIRRDTFQNFCLMCFKQFIFSSAMVTVLATSFIIQQFYNLPSNF
jgi:hypothetical protein